MDTTADKHRDAALDHIQGAIRELSEIIVARCDGSDDFNEAYKSKLHRSFSRLIEIRDELK